MGKKRKGPAQKARDRQRDKQRRQVHTGRVCRYCRLGDWECRRWSAVTDLCQACERQRHRQPCRHKQRSGALGCGRPAYRYQMRTLCPACDAAELDALYPLVVRIILLCPDKRRDEERWIWRSRNCAYYPTAREHLGLPPKRIKERVTCVTPTWEGWRTYR